MIHIDTKVEKILKNIHLPNVNHYSQYREHMPHVLQHAAQKLNAKIKEIPGLSQVYTYWDNEPHSEYNGKYVICIPDEINKHALQVAHELGHIAYEHISHTEDSDVALRNYQHIEHPHRTMHQEDEANEFVQHLFLPRQYLIEAMMDHGPSMQENRDFVIATIAFTFRIGVLVVDQRVKEIENETLRAPIDPEMMKRPIQ